MLMSLEITYAYFALKNTLYTSYDKQTWWISINQQDRRHIIIHNNCKYLYEILFNEIV